MGAEAVNVGYASLARLSQQDSSEKRRALLRQVTGTLSHATFSEAERAALDDIMCVAATEYSKEVKMEFARLVAASSSGFPRATEMFAMDEIGVAEPVLRQARGVSDDLLLRVVSQKSQAHLLAVSKRAIVSARVSHALVEHGDDQVLDSLLENDGAQISNETFDMLARRADNCPALHAPLARRKDVPVDILHDMYLKVEAQLRSEIIEKFGECSPADLEKAFARSRARVTSMYHQLPADYTSAVQHVGLLRKRNQLSPDSLVSLLRGAASLTAFQVAFTVLADIEFDVVRRVTEKPDLDGLALLCRGANFDTSLFIVLALALSPRSENDPAAMGALYESVPVVAAQRALRFWKARSTSE